MQDEGMAVQAAEEIGFPVTLKAISGGGGMGLTPVHRLTWYEKGLRLYNQEERPFAKILEFSLSASIQQSHHRDPGLRKRTGSNDTYR